MLVSTFSGEARTVALSRIIKIHPFQAFSVIQSKQLLLALIFCPLFGIENYFSTSFIKISKSKQRVYQVLPI